MKANINELPANTQQIVKDTLKAFDQVNITSINGEYRVSTGTYLLDKYPESFKVIGSIHANDIYTKEQRYDNYEESFGYRPRVKIFG